MKPRGVAAKKREEYMREVEAYEYNISYAGVFGNSLAEVIFMISQRASDYNVLSKAGRSFIDRGIYYAPNF